MNTTSSLGRWRWRQNGVALALIASFFSAFVFTIDTQVTTNVIVHKNPLIAVLVYLILGSWVGVLCNIVYNRLLGKTFDPTFSGEYIMRGKSAWLVALAGAASSLGTFTYLFVAGKGDPSILIALGTLSVLYLAVYDNSQRLSGNIVPGILAALCVLLGVAFVSYQGNSTSAASITTWDIFSLVVIYSGLSAFAMVCIHKLGQANENMVNVSFWRFVWLAIFSTVLTLVISLAMGIFGDFVALLKATWLSAIGWVLLLMLLVYGSNTLGVLAQKFELPGTVTVIQNSKAILAAPIGIICAWLWPDMFNVPSGWLVWVVRIVGAVLISLAILIVPKQDNS